MQIKDILLEAKFSKPTYAYHATKLKHVPSILKHGLIPNKSEGGYGSDEQDSALGYSLTALPGTYFTSKPKAALSIATSFTEAMAIIVCKVQRNGSATLDEDRMKTLTRVSDFIYAIRKQFRDYFLDQEEYEDIYKDIDEFVDRHVEQILKSMTAIGSPLQMATKAHAAEIKKILSDYFDHVAEYALHDTGNEHALKYQENQLTLKLRNYIRTKNDPDDELGHTFKINEPIGFSGANRIVGIFNVQTNIGYGDLGQLAPWAYHISKKTSDVLK
jgi:hypothetical protein